VTGASGEISAVIAAIKTDANGANVSIQFGNGTDALDIGVGTAYSGTGVVVFSGAGWGDITITGKIIADRSGNTVVFDGVTGIINADITNINHNWHAVGKRGAGTLIVNGGRITGGDNGISIQDTSVGIINGGTITGKTGVELGNSAKLTVNDGAIIGTSYAGVWLTNNSNTLTVTGGAIQGTKHRAIGIYNAKGGTIILSGGSTLITSAALTSTTGSNNERATICLLNSENSKGALTIGTGVTITNTAKGGLEIFNHGNRAVITDNRQLAAPETGKDPETEQR